MVYLTCIAGRVGDVLDRVPAEEALSVFKKLCRDAFGHAVQSGNINVCYRVLGLLDVPPIVFKCIRCHVGLIRQIVLNYVEPGTVFIP